MGREALLPGDVAVTAVAPAWVSERATHQHFCSVVGRQGEAVDEEAELHGGTARSVAFPTGSLGSLILRG